MIDIKRFQMTDLAEFSCKYNDLDSSLVPAMADSNIDMWSLVKGNTVIAIVAMIHKRAGVAEVSLIPCLELDSYKFEFFKTLKLFMDFMFEKMALHRFEMAIDVSWEGRNKWAEKLGFEFEGTAKKWCHEGKDHDLYSKVV